MLGSPRDRILTLLVLATAMLAPASGHAAGTSPLHLDPSSPVAKAYALPLGQARAPGGDGHPGRLFGAGLSAPRRGTDTRVDARPAAYLRPDTASAWLWMGLGAAVVLLAGGAGGLALRRRR